MHDPRCEMAPDAGRPEQRSKSPDVRTGQSGPLDSTIVPIANSSVPPKSASESNPTAKSGQTLGQYELLGLLGQGGMGAVYTARHTSLDKLVALKLLSADFMRSEKSVIRFKREMKAVGKIDHPNIVRAMDAGEVGGTHYLAMELVEGADLEKVVKERGPFSVKDACKTIRQAALGLHAAHKAGLVHRDIKPSNLLLAKNGHVKDLWTWGLPLIGDEMCHLMKRSHRRARCWAPPGTIWLPSSGKTLILPTCGQTCTRLGCTLFYLLVGRAPFADRRIQVGREEDGGRM